MEAGLIDEERIEEWEAELRRLHARFLPNHQLNACMPAKLEAWAGVMLARLAGLSLALIADRRELKAALEAARLEAAAGGDKQEVTIN